MINYSPEKTVNYNRNGSGRDTYISCSNGGFAKNFNINKGGYELGSMKEHVILRRQPTLPQLIGGGQKMRHYNQNGTGRDSYIMDNEGGFVNSPKFNKTKDNYISSLRNYKQIEFGLRENDYIRQSQLRVPLKQAMRQQQKFTIVKSLTHRLTSSKRIIKTEINEDHQDFNYILRKY